MRAASSEEVAERALGVGVPRARVGDGRSRHGDDVDGGDQLRLGFEHRAADARRQRLGVGRVMIVDADQRDAREAGQLLGVITAKHPCPDHAGAQRLSHRPPSRKCH